MGLSGVTVMFLKIILSTGIIIAMDPNEKKTVRIFKTMEEITFDL